MDAFVPELNNIFDSILWSVQQFNPLTLSQLTNIVKLPQKYLMKKASELPRQQLRCNTATKLGHVKAECQ